ncbi:MAG TPA: Uma2 family endonuclease [Verrucomicrobiae bacterium]|nr:Uma2 family endonuclease [Verrucomicrobiae bacterium]
MVTLPPELLQAPELALYGEQIQARLEQERQLRDKFRSEVSAGVKAEFINGEVIVHSPATTRHTIVRMHLSLLLTTYARMNRLGLVLDEKAMISLSRNDYEPDVLFFSAPQAARIQPGQLLFPTPDFIAEVLSASTVDRDRGVKFRDYAAHGVPEYWLLEPEAATLEQHELKGSAYALRLKASSGHVRSLAIPGFEIPVRALFDPEENLACLKQLVQAGPS